MKVRNIEKRFCIRKAPNHLIMARGFPFLLFAEKISLIFFDLRPFTLTKNCLSDKNFTVLKRVGNRNKYVKK